MRVRSRLATSCRLSSVCFSNAARSESASYVSAIVLAPPSKSKSYVDADKSSRSASRSPLRNILTSFSIVAVASRTSSAPETAPADVEAPKNAEASAAVLRIRLNFLTLACFPMMTNDFHNRCIPNVFIAEIASNLALSSLHVSMDTKSNASHEPASNVVTPFALSVSNRRPTSPPIASYVASDRVSTRFDS
jgi:hypothetical protein